MLQAVSLSMTLVSDRADLCLEVYAIPSFARNKAKGWGTELVQERVIRGLRRQLDFRDQTRQRHRHHGTGTGNRGSSGRFVSDGEKRPQ